MWRSSDCPEREINLNTDHKRCMIFPAEGLPWMEQRLCPSREKSCADSGENRQIFQSFNLITRTTVIKNVLTAFVPNSRMESGSGIFKKEEKLSALEALDRWGFWRRHLFGQISFQEGSSRESRLPGRCPESQIILADEPVASWIL